MATPIRTVWNATIGQLRNQYEKELSKIVGSSCESLLDVGCGFDSPVSRLLHRPKRMVGVDGFAPVVEESRTKGIHDEYHEASLLDIRGVFEPASFDVVLASDVIEHFSEEDGLELLEQMESVAKKKVVVYTPNGFLAQGEEYGNPMQKHLSGWTVEQMESLGYRVVGIQGIKCMRGEMAAIKWRPYFVWHSVSLLSQFLTRNHPSWAFRILCVKDVG